MSRLEHLWRNQVWIVAFLVCVRLAAPGSAGARTAATLEVCDKGAAFTTIQSAVDAAAPGDRIAVCAGRFPEQLVVRKSVTLTGAGTDKTTIAAPSPLTGDQDIVTIGGSGVDVDLSGLTVKGPGPTGDCTGLLSGIFVRDGAHATIHGTVIASVRDDPLDGCQKGAGIRVGRAALSTSGTASIADNAITDYQKTGIVVDGAGSAATIVRNTIVGAGETGVLAQNGIQVSRNATATVSDNAVSRNSYSGGGATGILLFGQLGDVTVANNRLDGNDVGISAASVVPTGGKVIVRGNTITGGDRGISLTGTVETLVENNETRGAATFGIHAGQAAERNTFSDNEATGVTGDAHFDCRDESQGNRSDGTANVWETNTGATASPDGICSPKAAPPPHGPVVVDPPAVIVLPPIPESEVESAAAGNPVPEDIVNPEQPPQPGGPVAEAAADEIIAKMEDEQLESCLVQLTSRGPDRLVVARGLARARAGGQGQMVVRLGVQPKGQRLLASQFGGAVVDVRAACRTTANKPRSGVRTARVVLAIEHVVTTPGSWIPDLPLLTPAGQRFVDRLSKRMVAIERIRCDGYTATWLPSPADPMALSLARAQLVCGQLQRSGRFAAKPRLVPHGRSDPVATNATEEGRAANRRVEITFVHRLLKRTRNARV